MLNLIELGMTSVCARNTVPTSEVQLQSYVYLKSQVTKHNDLDEFYMGQIVMV